MTKKVEHLEFENIIKDISENNTVLKMQKYEHHVHTTCYDHCKNVAYYSYLITKKLGLNYVSTAKACMVHDLFLYNWKGHRIRKGGLHGFIHPKIALENANKLFDFTEKEQDIILKHMWPMTIILPKYKESYIVAMVDKYCAIMEYVMPLFNWFSIVGTHTINYLKFLNI